VNSMRSPKSVCKVIAPSRTSTKVPRMGHPGTLLRHIGFSDVRAVRSSGSVSAPVFWGVRNRGRGFGASLSRGVSDRPVRRGYHGPFRRRWFWVLSCLLLVAGAILAALGRILEPLAGNRPPLAPPTSSPSKAPLSRVSSSSPLSCRVCTTLRWCHSGVRKPWRKNGTPLFSYVLQEF
jgi:hypothetical protein